jgi:uncharacterized small protein (DUF1192 family)
MSNAKVFKLTGIACQSQLISCSSAEPDAWVPLADHCEEVKALKMERIHDLNQIGGLQEELSRLKAEVEMLSKPAIIGGYNLSQYIRMANSETLEFDNGDIFADMTLPERIKYIVESHARLKAEVERLTKAGDAMARHLDYGDFPISLEAWNAAKEGKQSE